MQCMIVCCRCVAVCCSVLKCFVVCCSAFYCVAGCCRVLLCVAVCCSMLQRVAACCSILLIRSSARQDIKEWSTSSVLQICCSVLQCVAVCCRYVAACCSVLQYITHSIKCATGYQRVVDIEYSPDTDPTRLVMRYPTGVSYNTATHCNTLQHTATHCKTRCNALQHTATHLTRTPHVSSCATLLVCFITLQHTAIHCNTLQHTATHCNTLQLTSHGPHTSRHALSY